MAHSGKHLLYLIIHLNEAIKMKLAFTHCELMSHLMEFSEEMNSSHREIVVICGNINSTLLTGWYELVEEARAFSALPPLWMDIRHPRWKAKDVDNVPGL